MRGHVLDLLFVPVIVVPAMLAWTAMAAYGTQLYGPLGLALPAFSEGSMWAFAAATTLTRRRRPDAPVWHLRAGTVTFAAIGAALNFTHGALALPGQHGPHGPGAGVVMALISVAGVVAHQLITAGPARPRAERDAARIARAAARREMAARRAAVRHAVADLDEHGHARLVYQPGLATLARRRGRVGLHPATVPQVRPWPRPAPVLPPAPVSRAPGGPPAPAPAAAPAPARTRDRGAPRTRTPRLPAPGPHPGRPGRVRSATRRPRCTSPPAWPRAGCRRPAGSKPNCTWARTAPPASVTTSRLSPPRPAVRLPPPGGPHEH